MLMQQKLKRVVCQKQTTVQVCSLHLSLIQSLTHFRIVFGLQFLKSDPVETIHPLVETKLCLSILVFRLKSYRKFVSPLQNLQFWDFLFEPR